MRGLEGACMLVIMWKGSLMFKAHATQPLLAAITKNEAWFEESVTYCTGAS